MRCIEILISLVTFSSTPSWLTLTWDVLKSAQASNILASVYRLTLTWDVLKCTSA